MERYMRGRKPLDPRTPLHLASKIGNFAIFKTTFEEYWDKNPNDGINTPLHIAASKGLKDICKLIIDCKTSKKKEACDGENGWTPLHYAVNNGNFELCKLIIERELS